MVLILAILVVRALALLPAQPAASGRQMEVHLAKARELLKQNRPDLAIGEFRAIVALDANNGEAHANLGVLLFFQGDYAKAAPELREALRLKPELWKIQALVGLSERRMGQTEGARKSLEHAFPKLEEEKLRVEVGMELTELRCITPAATWRRLRA